MNEQVEKILYNRKNLIYFKDYCCMANDSYFKVEYLIIVRDYNIAVTVIDDDQIGFSKRYDELSHMYYMYTNILQFKIGDIMGNRTGSVVVNLAKDRHPGDHKFDEECGLEEFKHFIEGLTDFEDCSEVIENEKNKFVNYINHLLAELNVKLD